MESSNCEFECNKACDVGEYWDYENCRCKKRLIVEEVKAAIITLAENENSYNHSSRIVYSVLFWIVFTINVGVNSVGFFSFYWYLKKDALHVYFNADKETTIC